MWKSCNRPSSMAMVGSSRTTRPGVNRTKHQIVVTIKKMDPELISTITCILRLAHVNKFLRKVPEFQVCWHHQHFQPEKKRSLSKPNRRSKFSSSFYPAMTRAIQWFMKHEFVSETRIAQQQLPKMQQTNCRFCRKQTLQFSVLKRKFIVAFCAEEVHHLFSFIQALMKTW